MKLKNVIFFPLKSRVMLFQYVWCCKLLGVGTFFYNVFLSRSTKLYNVNGKTQCRKREVKMKNDLLVGN